MPEKVWGTLEELEKHGLDPKQYRSCAVPVKDQVLGCIWLEAGQCVFGCRLKHGPRRYGFQITKPKTLTTPAKVVEGMADCFAAMTIRKQARSARHFFKIVATEVGYETGLKHSVMMRGTEPINPAAVKLTPKDVSHPYKPWQRLVEIHPFERLDQSPEIAQDIYAAKVAQDAEIMSEQEQYEQMFAIKRTRNIDEVPGTKPEATGASIPESGASKGS